MPGMSIRTVVIGSSPARTILDVGKRAGVDLIMITSPGRGGMHLFLIGGLAQRVVHLSGNPLFIIPINKELAEVPHLPLISRSS